MCFFKKKHTVDKNKESKELVSAIAGKAKALVVLATNENNKKQLEELANQVEYMDVSPKEEVKKIDRKISDLLDDMKIQLTRSERKGSDAELDKLIKEIQVKLVERKTAYFSDKK